MVNNYNPYPHLEENIIELLVEQSIVKSTDIIESMKPCSESTVRAHLNILRKKKIIKKVYQLTDMRAAYYAMEGKT